MDEESRLEEKLQRLDKKIENAFAKKEKVIAEREKVISMEEKVIAEEEKVIAEKEKVLAEKEKVIAEEEKLSAEEEKLIAKEEKLIAKKEKVIAKLEAFKKLKQSELKKSKGKEALRDPMARKRKRVEHPYIGFVLNDLRNEKKKVEEFKVSKHLRSGLPVNDWKRKRTIKNLKSSERKVKELELEYQRLAFPRVSAGEDAQLREDDS